jgi:hypothetical protein
MNSTEAVAAYQTLAAFTDLQLSFLNLQYTLVTDKYSATKADSRQDLQ